VVGGFSAVAGAGGKGGVDDDVEIGLVLGARLANALRFEGKARASALLLVFNILIHRLLR